MTTAYERVRRLGVEGEDLVEQSRRLTGVERAEAAEVIDELLRGVLVLHGGADCRVEVPRGTRGLPDVGQKAGKMMIDVRMIRSAFLLALCLCGGNLHARVAVYEPVLADGGRTAVLRLPGDLSNVPSGRLSLEKAPPGARLSRDGAGGSILSWPVTGAAGRGDGIDDGVGLYAEVVFALSVGEGSGPAERRRLRVRLGDRATPTPFASDTAPDSRAPAKRRAVTTAAKTNAPDTAARGVVDGRPEWRSRPRAATPTLGAARRGNAPPELGRIGPQRLVAGRLWQLHVRVRDADGDEPVFFTAGLPESATFRRARNGWLVLGWTPPPEAAGEVDVTVGAADGRDPRLRTERVVRLRVVSAPVGSGASGPPSAAPVELAPALPLSAHLASNRSPRRSSASGARSPSGSPRSSTTGSARTCRSTGCRAAPGSTRTPTVPARSTGRRRGTIRASTCSASRPSTPTTSR